LLTTKSTLTERHFRGAPYSQPSDDHGGPRTGPGSCRTPGPGCWPWADATTLTGELSEVLDGVRGRARGTTRAGCWSIWPWRSPTARRRSATSVLSDQPALFGPVASDSTCWRLLDALDERRLSAVAGARGAGPFDERRGARRGVSHTSGSRLAARDAAIIRPWVTSSAVGSRSCRTGWAPRTGCP
jgi:hypothetical protein